jgi:hypothetical protein
MGKEKFIASYSKNTLALHERKRSPSYLKTALTHLKRLRAEGEGYLSMKTFLEPSYELSRWAIRADTRLKQVFGHRYDLQSLLREETRVPLSSERSISHDKKEQVRKNEMRLRKEIAMIAEAVEALEEEVRRADTGTDSR